MDEETRVALQPALIDFDLSRFDVSAHKADEPYDGFNGGMPHFLSDGPCSEVFLEHPIADNHASYEHLPCIAFEVQPQLHSIIAVGSCRS